MNHKVVIGVAIAAALVASAWLLKPAPTTVVNNHTVERTLGSVSVSNEYSRVNLANSAAFGATTTPQRDGLNEVIKQGGGALGSVIITGAAAGAVNFYDATTTNIVWRTGNKATSTILLASLPVSLVAGTYVFDIEFRTGLLVDVIGVVPTSTVTYRQD